MSKERKNPQWIPPDPPQPSVERSHLLHCRIGTRSIGMNWNTRIISYFINHPCMVANLLETCFYFLPLLIEYIILPLQYLLKIVGQILWNAILCSMFLCSLLSHLVSAYTALGYKKFQLNLLAEQLKRVPGIQFPRKKSQAMQPWASCAVLELQQKMGKVNHFWLLYILETLARTAISRNSMAHH